VGIRAAKPERILKLPIPLDLAPTEKPLVGVRSGPRIERILCAVDFSHFSARGYAYAQSIAGRYGATLIVENVFELWRHPSADYSASANSYADFLRKFMGDAENDLRQFVEKSGGIQPECVVREGMAADVILSLAQERAISLIVLGTHGRRGFNHLTLGSVTESVLRKASCPVLAACHTAPVSSERDALSAPVLIHKILCCVDFSAHSARAVEYALSFAEAYGSAVTVLHVQEDASNSEAETAKTVEDLEKLIPRAAVRPAKIDFVVRVGTAHLEILQFASEVHSDLIVTGVRGRHALDLAVFGSTTYQAIQRGSCPVLTVPI
jgi:nucleotide-binding universal stress UspA family protein